MNKKNNAPRLVLSENARLVLEKRYLLRDSLKHVYESPESLFYRVAHSLSLAEKKRVQCIWQDRFLEMMLDLRFLPNSPTLMNAGKENGQLSACFVLHIGSSSIPTLFYGFTCGIKNPNK